MKEKLINGLKWFFKSYIWLMVLVFVADITSKWIVQNNVPEGHYINVIPNFFDITLSHNLGAAFSIGADGNIAMRIMWICISVILSAALIFYYVKSYKTIKGWHKVAIALMIAGAVGNMIDRAFYWKAIVGFDGVIDWLSFLFGTYRFATFNIADSSLVVGVAILIIIIVVDLVKDGIKKGKEGAYKLTPEQYEAKQKEEASKKNSENLEVEPKEEKSTEENNEDSQNK